MKYRQQLEKLRKILARAYKGVQHLENWPELLDMPDEFKNRIVDPLTIALQTVNDIGKELGKRPIIEAGRLP